MAKCKKCNEEISPDADICPKCGTIPGTTETITDVVKPRSHHEHKLSRAEKRQERKAGKKRKCEK
ncbi:MAG: zinc-ribbon domain-containing protein [Actinomycetia bacterium]|nr:zinc-ribbon domain-containing protein [Actinomycetota bacterium]MCG2795440.1 zinc-ribbon domain-containing protein [Actinomycetes bacterium]MCG2820178.1 zinc-ribbon domain-containing protein [Actinomycetes bacterium]